jgi:EpsI family protein
MNRSLFRPVAVMLLLSATIAASLYSERRRPDSLSSPLQSIGVQLGGWKGVDDPPLAEGIVASLKPTSYLSRQYSKGGVQLGLFISYYDQQRSGESMHSPKHCLPANGWEIWKAGSTSVPFAGRQVKINHYSIQHTGKRAVVYYWYQSRDRIIASEYLGKVYLIKDALLSSHTSGSIVRLMIEDRPDAVQAGLEFASLIMPEVQRCFGR